MNRLLFVLLLTSLAACGGKKNPSAAENDEAPKPANHIPFTYMLQEQVRYIDSTPLPLNKYEKKDSAAEKATAIDRAELKQLAAIFMAPDFGDAAVKAAYSENSYVDATTNTVTFNYETDGKQYPVKKVFLNFTNNPEGQSKLKWVSLLRESGDTIIKLYWKTNSYFLIGKSWRRADGQTTESTTRVVWDASDIPDTPDTQVVPGIPGAGKQAGGQKEKAGKVF